MSEGAKITREEMQELFGDAMPIEAVNLVSSSDGSKTVGQIRGELRAIAAQRQSKVPTLERCARALALETDGEADYWESYISDVRCVVEALMEPDEAMLEAMWEGYKSEGMKEAWQAALRSVLGGEG